MLQETWWIEHIPSKKERVVVRNIVPVSKRPKLSFDTRVERMKALEEEIKNVQD